MNRAATTLLIALSFPLAACGTSQAATAPAPAPTTSSPSPGRGGELPVSTDRESCVEFLKAATEAGNDDLDIMASVKTAHKPQDAKLKSISSDMWDGYRAMAQDKGPKQFTGAVKEYALRCQELGHLVKK